MAARVYRKVEQVVEETRAVQLALDRHNRKERRCGLQLPSIPGRTAALSTAQP